MQNTTPFQPQKNRYSASNLIVTLIVALLLSYLAWRLISYTGKTEVKADPVPTVAMSIKGLATTVATYTSGKHPCTAISDECGDKATWREWTDVDKSAITSGASTVLDCARVFKRNDTGAGYNMDGATHTQIATWFSLSKADRIAFLNDCK